MRRTDASLLLTSLVCSACSDLPPVVWSGKRIDFAADPDNAATICEGMLPFADAQAEAIAQWLGRPKDERVTFYFLPDLDADAPCHYGRSAGCGSHGVAYSATAESDHEVVHAFATRMGDADPVLVEGLAEYLGGNNLQPAAGDPRDVIARNAALYDPTFYPVAGRFVARLVEWSSPEAVLALYRNSDPDDDAATFTRLVERHTGLSMDDVAESLLDEPSCGSLAYRERSRVCSQTPIRSADDDHEIAVEKDLDCGDRETIGRESSLRWVGTIELESPYFWANVSDGTTAVVSPCEPGCAAGDSINVFNPLLVPVALEPGRYQVVLTRHAPGLASLTLE